MTIPQFNEYKLKVLAATDKVDTELVAKVNGKLELIVASINHAKTMVDRGDLTCASFGDGLIESSMKELETLVGVKYENTGITAQAGR